MSYSPLDDMVFRNTGFHVVAEHRFHPTRDWCFDFAVIEAKVAVEVEGGLYNGGRHFRPEGFLRDMEKYNEAAACGWLLIRVLPSELLTMRTVRLIVRAVNSKLKIDSSVPLDL